MKSLLSYKVEKMNKKTKNIKQQGQVALMVILASALILTLGLSASRQATVETKIDTDQEMLKKAFNAAESGIEHYFGTGSTKYTGDELQGSANLNVKNFGDSQKLSFNSVTLPGDTEYFWLVDRQINGSLGSNYYSTSNPSISICDLDKKTGTYKISYFYLSGSTYTRSNQVVTTDSTGCIDGGFNLLAGNSLLLTVTPIGWASKIQLGGSTNFPIQGEEISSTGMVSGVNNTVTILNRYEVPGFMLEAITSGGKVTNN